MKIKTENGLKKAFVLQKIARVFSLLVLVCAIASIILSFIFDKQELIAKFIFFFVMGVWLLSYGISMFLTLKPIFSLYYPTICVSAISLPPILCVVFTKNLKPVWLDNLILVFGFVVGVILFCLTLYFAFSISKKHKEKYVSSSSDKFGKRSIDGLGENCYLAIENNKRDYAKFITGYGINSWIIIEKYNAENDSYSLYNFASYTEADSCVYFAVKNLNELGELDDGRKQFELEQHAEIQRFISMANSFLQNNDREERFYSEKNSFSLDGNVLILKKPNSDEKILQLYYEVEYEEIVFIKNKASKVFTANRVLPVFEFVLKVLKGEVDVSNETKIVDNADNE